MACIVRTGTAASLSCLFVKVKFWEKTNASTFYYVFFFFWISVHIKCRLLLRWPVPYAKTNIKNATFIKLQYIAFFPKENSIGNKRTKMLIYMFELQHASWSNLDVLYRESCALFVYRNTKTHRIWIKICVGSLNKNAIIY